MHALVVYESVYGNTRAIAEAVARGLQRSARVDVCRVGDPASWQVGIEMCEVDLLVLGAPTHTWSMSRPATRQDAVARAHGDGLTAEPYAGERGMREWLETPPCLPTRVAVFDTRRRMPVVLSGSAARTMRHEVRSHGYPMIGTPTSFFVDRDTHLEPGELDRAEQWGAALADSFARETATG
jgi:hypothetical protein